VDPALADHQQVDFVPAAVVVAELEVRPGAERVAGWQQRLDNVQALSLVRELGRRDLGPALWFLGHEVTSPASLGALSNNRRSYCQVWQTSTKRTAENLRWPTLLLCDPADVRLFSNGDTFQIFSLSSTFRHRPLRFQSVALVELRHFIVDNDSEDLGLFEDLGLPIPHLASQGPLQVDVAALLEANAMAQHDVEEDLRYRVLQHELRIVLSYLTSDSPNDWLKLDAENFLSTAGHIKRFISESVGLGMLTAAVQEFFALELGPDAIANFDILPGELKKKLGTTGVRPDLLFNCQDDDRALAGEARGRSRPGQQGDAVFKEQMNRMKNILDWSYEHGSFPVTMTYTFLGGAHAQVDLFTMPTESPGGLKYMPPAGPSPSVIADQRQQVTYEAIGRRERRAARLFETAPQAPAREPRRLFDQEVRGDWVTADLVRASNVRLFVGATDTPFPAPEVRAARSRTGSAARRTDNELETALSDRLLIVVARSEEAEPEWSHVETFIERGESDI
jgi:hypothetical protein